MANFLDEQGLSTLWERIKELLIVKTANLQTALGDKMDKENPTGTGSFSLNRKTNTTIGNYSVAEGYQITASGSSAHAEGNGTTASGGQSHAEGYQTTASGACSHAEGHSTTASGGYSHTEGWGTTASGSYSHAQGKHNVANTSHADIVGNGTNTSNRSNAYALDWSGNGYYAGDVYVGCDADSSGGQKVLAGCPFPVNGIYMSMDSANPSTIWSGTTWQRISKGKVLVGVDEDDTDFAANATGGEKTHKLTKAESGLPSHGHSDTFKLKMASPNNSGSLSTDQVNYGKPTGTTYTNANPISGGVSNNSGWDASQAHNNLQPYMTCYIWQRTA